MERNKECQIVEDLLIGYKDETLNPESKKLVDNHLLYCDRCKEILKDINSEDTDNEIEDKELDHLKKIKNKINIKNKLIMAGIFVLGIIIILNVIVFINYRQKANTLQIYLNNDINAEDLQKIKDEIKKVDNDAEIQYFSQSDELNNMKEKFKVESDILNNYTDSSLFPASYIVKTDYSKLKDIENKIINLNGIKIIKNSVNENPYVMFLKK